MLLVGRNRKQEWTIVHMNGSTFEFSERGLQADFCAAARRLV